MSLPTPADVNDGLDYIEDTYGVELSDALLVSADCGDPVLRWHRKAGTVAVGIARALVAARRPSDSRRRCGVRGRPGRSGRPTRRREGNERWGRAQQEVRQSVRRR
jgi:hypothetical protein